MACVGQYLRLVFFTMAPLTTNISGATLEGIRRSTAVSLIFLKNYQKQVAIHGKRADEIHRLQFINKWESVLGNHDSTVDVLHHVERDWMYTLHLACNSKDDIMGLMVTLHAKILALHHILSYVIGIYYYTMIQSGAKLYYCQRMLFHLLIFSHEGTEELIQSFRLLINSSLSEDESYTIKTIGDKINYHIEQLDVIKEVLPRVRLNVMSIQRFETTIKPHLIPTPKEHAEYSKREHLLSKLMFGSNKNEYVEDQVSDLNQLKLYWTQAEEINKFFTMQVFKNTNENEYTMADVLRAIIIVKTKISEMNRKNVVEKFERIIPNNLEIHISNNQITNNVNMENEYH